MMGRLDHKCRPVSTKFAVTVFNFFKQAMFKYIVYNIETKLFNAPHGMTMYRLNYRNTLA